MMLKKVILCITILMILFCVISCNQEDPAVAESKEWNSKGTEKKREGISLFKQGKFDEATKCYEEAEEFYKKALELDPENERAKQNL